MIHDKTIYFEPLDRFLLRAAGDVAGWHRTSASNCAAAKPKVQIGAPAEQRLGGGGVKLENL